MDFRQLQYIIKVAETRNITKAAAQLYIAQPSLSNYITKTEQELGVILFDRSVNPLRLTFAGEEYIKDAKKILEIQEQLQKKLTDISCVVKGRIKLGIPFERGSFMLPLIIPKYTEQFPDVKLEIITAGSKKLYSMLLDGDLDFYIAPTPTHENNCDYYPIYNEELFLCAGFGIVKDENLLPGHRDIVDISKCSNLPFIRVQAGHTISDMIENLFNNIDTMHSIKPAYTAHGNSTAIRFAANGMGATIVPRMTLDLIRYDHGLRVYSIGNPPLTWEVNAVFRKDTYIGCAELSFVKLAQQIFNIYSYKN